VVLASVSRVVTSATLRTAGSVVSGDCGAMVVVGGTDDVAGLVEVVLVVVAGSVTVVVVAVTVVLVVLVVVSGSVVGAEVSTGAGCVV
jgi:hypothetical protein